METIRNNFRLHKPRPYFKLKLTVPAHWKYFSHGHFIFKILFLELFDLIEGLFTRHRFQLKTENFLCVFGLSFK